jgi:hypothetical protein
MNRKKLNRILDIIREEMALHQGQIAGTVEAGDDPPVKPRKKKKYIYMKGVRKNWKPENGGAS